MNMNEIIAELDREITSEFCSPNARARERQSGRIRRAWEIEQCERGKSGPEKLVTRKLTAQLTMAFEPGFCDQYARASVDCDKLG